MVATCSSTRKGSHLRAKAYLYVSHLEALFNLYFLHKGWFYQLYGLLTWVGAKIGRSRHTLRICVMFYQEFLKEVSLDPCCLLSLSMIYQKIFNLQSLLSLLTTPNVCVRLELLMILFNFSKFVHLRFRANQTIQSTTLMVSLLND